MRDLWLTRREAIKIDRIKKLLTISAATYSTFRRNACLEYNVTDNNDNRCSTPDFPNNSFTLELWFKPLSSAATKQVLFKFGDATPQIELSILNNGLTAKLWDAGIPTSLGYAGVSLSFNWNHVAVTYDNAVAILYINGIEVANAAIAGPLDSGSVFSHVAQSAVLTEQFIGRIGEIRIWNVTRTSEQVFQAFDNPRILNGGDTTGLVHYWKCNGVSVNGNGEEVDQFSAIRDINASSGKFVTEDYPPLIFGASFAAAEFSVSGLGYGLSFQFPVIKPDDTTGMLVVRWIDEDGEVQRRRFWDLDGVDIEPFPEIYLGEAVPEDFVLEWYNIDGQDELVVSEDIVLRISKCTAPTTSSDTTPVSAATMTENTELGTSYPLTFPLVFDQLQNYT